MTFDEFIEQLTRIREHATGDETVVMRDYATNRTTATSTDCLLVDEVTLSLADGRIVLS